VCWRKLREVENECAAHRGSNRIFFGGFVLKIIKAAGNMTTSWPKNFFAQFCGDGVVCLRSVFTSTRISRRVSQLTRWKTTTPDNADVRAGGISVNTINWIPIDFRPQSRIRHSADVCRLVRGAIGRERKCIALRSLLYAANFVHPADLLCTFLLYRYSLTISAEYCIYKKTCHFYFYNMFGK